MQNFPWGPFLLTLFAGLSTGLGSLLGLLAKKTNTAFLSVSMGFSAGVMVYVAFMEILPEGRVALAGSLGETAGNAGAVASFFGGIALIAIIDKLVPHGENPHEARFVEEMRPDCAVFLAEHASTYPPGHVSKEHDPQGLKRIGILTALAIGLHNFPEGLATFATGINDINLGVAIAVAVAIHNIPEGIAVSVPIYHATGNRAKAFAYSFLSGLAEPAGALIGFILFRPFFSDAFMGVLLGAVAGIMVFISFDELLPAAEEYGEHHLCTYGLLAGMLVMGASLLILE